MANSLRSATASRQCDGAPFSLTAVSCGKVPKGRAWMPPLWVPWHISIRRASCPGHSLGWLLLFVLCQGPYIGGHSPEIGIGKLDSAHRRHRAVVLLRLWHAVLHDL